MIEYRDGDLFKQDDLDAWAHGCNIRGVMGAGIALQFRRKFPDMFDVYRLGCEEKSIRAGSVMSWIGRDRDNVWTGRVIYNLMTQVDPGADATLGLVDQAVFEMLHRADESNTKTIGMPEIGCGIGGLKWPDVEEVLEHNLALFDAKIVVVRYKP